MDAALRAYWDDVDAELAVIDVAPEIEPSRRLSSSAARVSLLRFTGIGHTRLTAYVSVPSGVGPFAGLLVTPRYGSVNYPPHPFDQERYVTLVLNHRGQRLSDVPWRAAYPGLLVEGIRDPRRYVMRAIAADCLRALDLLAARPEVDATHVGVTGGDLALVVAARRPSAVRALALTEPLQLYRLADAAARTDSYPWQELNDELRADPTARDAITATLRSFDLPGLAAEVRARVLLPIGDPGCIGGPEWNRPLTEALGGRVEQLALTHFGATDQDAADDWLSGQLGVPARPRGWQVAG